MTDLKSKNWRELIKPKWIEIDQDSHTKSYGKFICEPLERGFGITIGNSLRRILLSSLQGAAIVSVKFDGVLHEFSTIPGMREDVADVLTLEERPSSLQQHGAVPIRIAHHGHRKIWTRAPGEDVEAPSPAGPATAARPPGVPPGPAAL